MGCSHHCHNGGRSLTIHEDRFVKIADHLAGTGHAPSRCAHHMSAAHPHPIDTITDLPTPYRKVARLALM